MAKKSFQILKSDSVCEYLYCYEQRKPQPLGCKTFSQALLAGRNRGLKAVGNKEQK
jgi:hypothetical protein